jgi:hypothetical protein
MMDQRTYKKLMRIKEKQMARRIQRWWRVLYWHPDSQICRQRIFRTLDEIEYSLRVFQYEQESQKSKQKNIELTADINNSLKRQLDSLSISGMAKKRRVDE